MSDRVREVERTSPFPPPHTHFPIATKAQNPESVTLGNSDQSACSAYRSHSTGLA